LSRRSGGTHGTAASEARHSKAPKKRGEPTFATTDHAASSVTDANLQDPERGCLTQDETVPLSVKHFNATLTMYKRVTGNQYEPTVVITNLTGTAPPGQGHGREKV